MMDKPRRIAVVGATGLVGETMLSVLAGRGFDPLGIVPLASARSAGNRVACGNKQLRIEELATFDPAGIDIALFAAGSAIAKEFAPTFAAAGAVVIDNSSAFRYDSDVPLVVAEVNPDEIARRPRGIIANPNCSTIQMLLAIAPIHRSVGIERIEVATYQSVSGAGKAAMEELGRQTAALLAFQKVKPDQFPVQIAFNVIPHIDDFQDDGSTREEWKMIRETQKILGDESVQVNPTCVRVPVFFGHAEAVHLELRAPMTAAAARKLLRSCDGISVVDRPRAGGYPTPVTHAAGEDAVFVGRVRNPSGDTKRLNLWIVADNVRKGAALNAVQIAERVTK